MRGTKRYSIIKNVFTIVVIFSIFFLVVLSSGAQKKSDKHYVVYFNPDVTVKDPLTAVSAMKPFTDYVGKKLGIVIEPHYFIKQVDLERFLDTNAVSFGIFSQVFIVENFKKRNFEPICIVINDGESFYRKVILVRKDSPHETLEDLKGKILASTALGEDNVPFLNKVVFQGEIDVRTHFSEVKIVDSANSAIMAVLYKQAEAADTNYWNFLTLQELNPRVGRELKSIYTSAQTPLPGLVVFKDRVSDELRQRTIDEMVIMHNSPTGSQAMLAFSVEAWIPATIEKWDATARLMNLDLKTGRPLAEEPTQVATLVKETEKTVPEKKIEPVASLTFKRIVALENDEKSKVQLTVTIEPGKTTVKPESVKAEYKLSTGEAGTINLVQTKANTFSGAIPLPAFEATADRKKIKYTIKSGDTLGKIAKKFLGSSRKYMAIASINNIKNPHVIYVGTELTIMSGEYSGVDINYKIMAQDQTGKNYKSGAKFKSVMR
ncbi:PhnD/SsuA/transferrin family substrate-binding protein [candidate division CSSED10-310 bacterium]|uniref:PhnD/SsuA/transferrin family substrate-binding protein n=1 Tax=candidate division CSSED10-310 bacterium TaxID=2855610 RepID=A0ABV6Z285_UNCC1